MELGITNEAIEKLLEKKAKLNFTYIRLGVTGGGCSGFKYVFDTDDVFDESIDELVDMGQLQFVVDKHSLPYLDGMTLDFKVERFNEYFDFINPKEQASCGCGESITFTI